MSFVATGRPEEVDRALRLVFGRYFPGSEVGEPHLTTRDTGVPAATLTARVVLPASAAAPGPGDWPAFSIPRGNGKTTLAAALGLYRGQRWR